MRLVLLPVMALTFLACNKQDSNIKFPKVDSLIALMDSAILVNLDNDNFQSALNYLDSVWPTVSKLKHFGATSRWLLNRGMVYQYQYEGYRDSAHYYLYKSLEIVKRTDSSSKYMIPPLTIYASLLAKVEKYDSALHYNHKALGIAKLRDTSKIVTIYKNLAIIYSYLEDDINQRKYLFEALRLAHSTELLSMLANNIAKYYVDKGNIDSAAFFFYKWIEDSTKNSDYDRAIKHENFGVLLALKHEYEEGLKHLMLALSLYKKHDQADGQIYLRIAEVHSRLKNYSTSNRYLDTAIKIAQLHDKESISTIMHKMADNKSKEGDFIKAYALFDSAFKMHLKNDSSSFLMQAQELETRYAVKAKDEQIAALAYQRKQRNVIIISMFVSLILASIVFVSNNRRRKLRLMVKEWELQQQLLRSQVSSHFLFNSFTIMQRLMKIGEIKSAIDFLLKLSTLTRISLENARENKVPLRQEIIALESYLGLGQYHLDNPFTYQLTFYPGYEMDDVLIPPMLIQPFVENSIIHGISGMKAGRIDIAISKNEYTLVCTIEDNGKGLSKTHSNGKRSFATSITQDRLQILHKQLKRPASLQIIDKNASNLGEGVKVILEVPYVKEF